MAIPIIFGAIAAGTALVGGGKIIQGISDTNDAKNIQIEAKDLLESAQKTMDTAKTRCKNEIENLGKEKLNMASTELHDFVSFFSLIKNVEIKNSSGLEELAHFSNDTISFKEMQKTVLAATDVLGSGLAGIGAGALLSWGTYGGVMALGTASTGAAISGLSGAAATNATLAWLGGGAIAAGGGGMALGTVVLGGILAGPALLVAGGLFSSKASENLNNAYSNLAEAKKLAKELKVAQKEINGIRQHAVSLCEITQKIKILLSQGNSSLKQTISEAGTDWKTYSLEQKQKVAASLKIAQLAKTVIDTPLLSDDGILTEDIKLMVSKKQEFLDLTPDSFSL